MVIAGRVMSAVELQLVFAEGRDALQTAINELKDVGLIETKKAKIEDSFVSYSGFLVPENPSLEIRRLCELLSQYSQYRYIANTAKSLTNSSEKNSDEETYKKISTPMEAWKEPVRPEDRDYFEEQERERVKAMARAQEAYNEQKQEAHEEKLAIRDRDHANPDTWSHSDSAYEFANQLHARWDVLPWRPGKSRFIPALAAARKKHGTKGAIEKRMTEIFLASPIVQTMKDPEQIWKFYIKSFGSLLEQARYSMPSNAKLQSLEEEGAADMAELMEGLTDV
jgi:hypothetical protein